MFGFLKDVGKELMDGGDKQDQSGQHGGGQQQHGGGGGGMNDLISGMASQVIGDMVSGSSGETKTTSSNRSQDDLISNLTASVVGNLMSSNQESSSPASTNDFVGSIASGVVKGLSRGQQDTTKKTGDDGAMNDIASGIIASMMSDSSGGQNMSSTLENLQKKGINQEMVGGIATTVVEEIVGDLTEDDQTLDGPKKKMATNVASEVIKGIISGEDINMLEHVKSSGVSDDDVASIATNVIKGMMTSDEAETSTPQNKTGDEDMAKKITLGVVKGLLNNAQNTATEKPSRPTLNEDQIASITSGIFNQFQSGGHGQPHAGGSRGGFSGDMVSGMASQYIGNMLSGGGGGGGGSGHRSKGDVISGIASSLIGSMISGGGGKKPGGAIASNIIGKIIGSQISTNDDGTVQENLTSMQVDPSKKRIFPDPVSLISSFLGKGGYKKFMKGKCSGGQLESSKAVFNYGERGSGLRPRGDVQDFYSLRDECLDSGTLFEDHEFPADDSTIFFSKSPPKPFEWKRPHEVSDDPQLFIDGASRFDVKQGELGDCWLLAAVANLTLSKSLFYQIVPSDQGFGDNYAGIFHFRFWQYGRWVDVVVDDRLPTYYNRLVFMHSEDNNEFWSALLEKAYAKLHGSYEALKGGTTCEAMEDFTGGVSEIYDLTKAPANMFNIMLKAYERGSLMGCSVEPDPNVVEARCTNGLVRGHAYSITRIKFCEIETPRVSGKIPLVRIRNPWGNEAEWNGSWSDQSEEWQFIPSEEREEMGLTFEHDGEFWMSYKDFTTNFTLLEMTNLSPETLNEDDLDASVKHHWEMSVFEGAWIRGATAGGCRNNLRTFHHNPQYRITLTEVDDDDEDNKCTVIIALMQKNRRAQRKLGLECLTIGFAIYHLRDPDNVPKPLDMNFFKYNASAARSPSFINMREVSCRFKLPPGTYCIVPSTFDPNDEGEFLLRVFSEKQNEMEENDEDVGVCDVDERVQPDEDQEEEVDDRVSGFFNRVAGDDMEIDNNELKGVLDYALTREFDFEGFTQNVVRSMIAMLDKDKSGKLGLQEFIKLWKNIRVWKGVFKLYDKDTSGHLNGFELREALHSAGYRLNNHILSALMLRYGDQEGNLSFDDFVMCSVKLKTLLGSNSDLDEEEKMAAFYRSLFKDSMAEGAECQQEEEAE